MNAANNIRKKKKYISPNPLFVKWLTEWKDEAAEKGLKAQYTYARALSSLKKYPLPLSSGKEAKILEYFGDKICAMLDAKLLQWRQCNSEGSSSSQSSTSSSSSSIQSSIPRSIVSSQSSSNSSPSKQTKQSSKISAIANVKTVHLGRVTTVEKRTLIDSDMQSNDAYSVEDVSFYLYPGSFQILLCVDNCETFSGQGRNKKLFLEEIQKTGISYDVRKLHVGDFLWVAQEISGRQRELVLDFIVERKRMDDLAKSIKDGRFREQKFRMKSCGLKTPIYLVEKGRDSNYLGLPLSTCEQAIINTQIIDGFIIKHTLNVKESVNYLSTMTSMIKNKFQNSVLMSAPKDSLQKKSFPPNTFMTFTEFNSSSMKNKSLTVREMFAKHLLQFFGLSVDRAAAIVDQFETPSKLLEAYDNCASEAEKEKLIASIKFGMHKKNIGPALSRSLYQFYCAENPPE